MRFGMSSLSVLFVLAAACGPNGDDPDAGGDASCGLEVTLGTGDSGSFQPLAEGATAELILGFQGFRMLGVAIEVGGAAAETADLTTYTTVTEADIELSQTNRLLPIVATTGGRGVIEEHLIFFNDAPASELIGRDAEIELIVRSGGCLGTSVGRVRIVDEEDCVDPDIVVDAGTLDAGTPDASTFCEEMP